MTDVSILKTVSEQTRTDLNRLMQQFRANSTDASLKDLHDLVTDPNATIVVAKDGGHIIGVATLFVLNKIGKKIGSIEDVIVDEAYRGRGLGKKMMNILIGSGKDRGLTSIGLTSRPAHEVANVMYQKLGFEIKETNVYRLYL